MLAVLRTWGRVLIMHGPALVAAYVIGHTAHYILIWVSGFVGAYSSFALVLVAPLAVLSKLLAFVAMMLITRDSLPHLSAAAPTGEQTPLERRVGFSEAVLSSVIPFFDFYYAAGFFREDLSRILTISQEQVFAGDGSETGNALQFEVNPSILALLLGCFVLKQVWEKTKDRLPSWTRIPAVSNRAASTSHLLTRIPTSPAGRYPNHKRHTWSTRDESLTLPVPPAAAFATSPMGGNSSRLSSPWATPTATPASYANSVKHGKPQRPRLNQVSKPLCLVSLRWKT